MNPYYEVGGNKIFQGDAKEVLEKLPDESVDMVMTSPPYWALRDYGEEGQLGLEPTFQEYIDKLVSIFDEVRRVLKDTGTLWVNLGDTYSANRTYQVHNTKGARSHTSDMGIKLNGNMQEKSLCCIPDRFKIAMVDSGWICRNEIIWYKKNCMPSSVKDRFTVDYEKIFFFSKKPKYYFEQQFDKAESNLPVVNKKQIGLSKEHQKDPYGSMGYSNGGEGRNKRCVWQINPKPFSEAHFAVYPEELCVTPIQAGCPLYICKKCGNIRERIIEKEISFHSGSGKSGIAPAGKWEGQEQQISGSYDVRMGAKQSIKEIGYTDCGCNAGFEAGVVLDPFFGSGTTGLVAEKLGRKWIGIELNPEYIEIAINRLKVETEQFKLNFGEGR